MTTKAETLKVADSRMANVLGVPKDAEILIEKDVRVPMRDGITLAANVFRPTKPGRYPVVLHLSQQGKDRLPADANYERIPNTGVIRVSELAVFEAQDPIYWVPHDYVVVVADCRATWTSEGDRFEHMSPQMGLDFHDLVEWAAVQEWSDGNVGANGVSYLAMIQWLGAPTKPPHLKAIIPWEGLTDIYREWAFHGGMPDTGFYRFYMSRTTDPKVTYVRKDASVEDMLQMQKEHPLFDDFWRAKVPDFSQIDVPAFIGASWSSTLHNRGAIRAFRSIASKDKWLEIHGRKEWEYYYSRECIERQRRFMDHFLKGEDTGIQDMPRVRFEVRDAFFEGRFRFASDFPVPGTDYRQLFLNPATGSLEPDQVAEGGTVRYSAVQSDSESDRAEFRVTFDERTEIVGHMKLRLWVSAEDADDLDIHVGIKKYDRRGNEVLMLDFNHCEYGMCAAGWLRVSHRELDEENSTPWQPVYRHERLQKLQPGEIVPVDIEIFPSGTGFDAGESLCLIIQGFDIIDFHYRYHHEDTINRGHHVIHGGGEWDSHLLIPVIPPMQVLD